MKTCYYCNTTVDDGAARCPSCGAYLPQVTGQTAPPPPPVAQPGPQQPVTQQPAQPPMAQSYYVQPPPYPYGAPPAPAPVPVQPPVQPQPRQKNPALTASLVGLGISLLALLGVVIAIGVR